MTCECRKNESLKILASLRGSDETANEELNEYALTTTKKKVNKMEVLKNKIFWKSFGMTIVVVVGAQLLGNHAVGLYLQTILESTEVSISPEISSVIIGIVQIIASIFTSATADRFGRKPILVTSLIGMMLGMIGIGSFFYVTKRADWIVGFMNYLPVISLAMVIFCFSSGPGSLNWVLSSELFDNNGRALGLSITMTLSSFTTFLVTKYFPYILASTGPIITYWGFAVNCLLLTLFVIVIIPETKGKTFVEIQRKLGAKIHECVGKNRIM